MEEQLQALIEQKILEWQRDGVYENIYAISLYVFDEEDEEGEEPAMQWQVYIHPDVPEPLEQYEKVMRAGLGYEELSDRNG